MLHCLILITGLGAGSYNTTIVDGNGCTSNVLAQGLNDPNPPTTPVITPSGATTFCDGGKRCFNIILWNKQWLVDF